jgi:hypothetical protein
MLVRIFMTEASVGEEKSCSLEKPVSKRQNSAW